MFMYAAASLLLFLFLLRTFSPQIYDVIIIHMTSKWYMAFFEKVAKNKNFLKMRKSKDNPPFRVLDVGIGTATALITQKEYLEKLNVEVVGVDYDATYVKAAQKSLEAENISGKVQVHCCSIYSATPVEGIVGKHGKFDAGYFSGSFSLMPDPLEALLVLAKYVKSGGRIFITQTFQRKGLPGAGIVKPLLKYVTTIDFGQLFFESQLDEVLQKSGMRVINNHVIDGSVDNMWQSARIVELEVL
jgi:SAM-dependent methyltransferase|eukprot:g6108.t1